MLLLVALGFAFAIVILLMVLLLLKRAAREMCGRQFRQTVSLSGETPTYPAPPEFKPQSQSLHSDH